MLQPKPKEKSQVLYDAVSKEYDLGTYEEFSQKLQDPEKRKAFYNGVGSTYSLGTYEEFETKISPSLKKKKEESQPTVQNQELVSEPKAEVGSLDGTVQPKIEAKQETLNPKPEQFGKVANPELFAERDTILKEYDQRPPMQVDNSDLDQKLKSVNDRIGALSKTKSGYRVAKEQIKETETKMNALESKAFAQSKATGMPAEEILRSDGTYTQLKKQKDITKSSIALEEEVLNKIKEDTNSDTGIKSFFVNISRPFGYTDKPEQTIKLDEMVEEQILINLSGDNRQKEKIAKGFASLPEKEMAITQAKAEVLNREVANIKQEAEALSLNPDLTEEEFKVKAQEISDKKDHIIGVAGYDVATEMVKNSFKKSELSEKYKEVFDSGGFFSNTGDALSTFAGGMLGTAYDGSVGFVSELMAGVGDITTDQDKYSAFDAFNDTVQQLGNMNFAPNSEADATGLTDEKGNYNINYKTISKSFAETLPFTLLLINDLKKGKVTNLEKGMGKLLNPKKSEKVTQSLGMIDSAFRFTFAGNVQMGKDAGLDDNKARIFGSVLSTAEGTAQLIMPDANFFKGTIGKTILDSFKGNLKAAATKSAIATATKNFTKNMLLEVAEEEVVAAVQDATKFAMVVGHENSEFFDMKQQKELAGATIIMSGILGGANVRNDIKVNKTKIYKDIAEKVDGVRGFLQTELQRNGITEAEVKEIDDAIKFADDITDAIKKSPKSVTGTQIELLVQKKRLLEQKETLDDSFHGKINEEIETLNEQINAENQENPNQAQERQVEEGTPNPEAVEEGLNEDLAPTETFEQAVSVEDGVYYYDGEKGQVKVDGQQVVFETDTKIHELGNINELSGQSIAELGIEREQELDITLNDDNSVTVSGETYFNNYSNPESAISQDKEGNYSVTLENDRGEKRTFRGQRADNIVYQTKLKNYENSATEPEVDRAIQLTDEAITVEGEIESTSPKRKDKSVRKGKNRGSKRGRKRTLKTPKIPSNEAAPPNNPSPNADVSVGVNPDVQQGQDNAPQPAIEPAASEGPVEVKPTPKKKKPINKNLRGRIPLDKREMKDPVMIKASKAEVSDAHSLVKQFFINGGRMTFDGLKEVIAARKKSAMASEGRARSQYIRRAEKGGKSFNDIVKDIFRAQELGLTEAEIREALIDVVREYNTPKAMALDLVAKINEGEVNNKDGELVNESGEKLWETPYGLMTQEEIDKLELNDKYRNDHLSLLTEEELISLENQQKEYEQVREREIREEDSSRGPKESGVSQEGVGNVQEKEGKQKAVADKTVTFTFLGSPLRGILQEDGSVIAKDGTKYSSSLAKNIKEVDEAEAGVLDKMDDILQKWDNDLKKFGKNNLSSMIVPIAPARIAIKAMRLAVKGAKTATEVIQAGIDAIKATEWYKNLSEARKGKITPENLQSILLQSVKINNELDQKLQDIRQKVKDNKLSQKEAHAEILDFLKQNKIVGNITAAETNRLIKAAGSILLKRDMLQAVDRFTELFKDIQKKAKRRALTKRQKNQDPDGAAIVIAVEQMVANGDSLDTILDAFDTPREKKVAETAYNAIQNKDMTPEQAYRKVKEAFKKSDEIINKKQSFKEHTKKAVRKFIEKYSDKQFLSKRLVDFSGMQSVKDLMINAHGASGRAKRMFEDAYDKIWNKLTTEDRSNLDEIIQLMRFVAIDKNRKDKNLGPVAHPDFIDGSIAKKGLEEYRNVLGDKKFNDLQARAKEYFKTYKGLLDEIYDNGMITKEAYDSMNGLDYQPRLFLEHITDFEGNVSLGSVQEGIKDTGGLAGDVIQGIKDGSNGALVKSAEWLLSTSIVSRSRAIAMNKINKKFMKEEFPKARARWETLAAMKKVDPKSVKDWNKEDKRFFEYFSELQSKIKDNPIIGTKKSGNPKFKYDKTPPNFKKAYWYEDGVRNEFFIEERLHDVWFDNLKGLFNGNTKDVLSMISGSALLKGIATGNNPAFAIVNTPRDFMFNVVFSDQYSSFVPKAMYQVGKDTFKAIKEIYKSGKNPMPNNLFQKYIEYGGDMAFLSTQGRLKKDTYIGQAVDATVSKKTRDISKGIFDKATLKKFSNYSEIMFRMALFDRSVRNQLKERGYKSMDEVQDKNEVDEIYNHGVANARSLLDFNQGGTVTKDLESVIPYLNTAVQGSRVAADAFAKNPKDITFRVLQTGALASSAVAGLSLAIISMLKTDDDEDKTAWEIYLDAQKGLSQYQRIQYFNIVTGRKDKDGEYEVIKIAKNQQLAPFINLSDNIISNKIADIAGQKRKSTKVIYDEAWMAFNNNMAPVDIGFISAPFFGKSLTDEVMNSGASTLTRTPMAKAILTYATGYDYYRQQPLSFDIGKVEKGAEGQTTSSVEDFYKQIGRDNGLSAPRLKGFVESLITTPSTNPFVGMLYGGAEYMTSDKDLKASTGDFAKTVMKSTYKRVVGNTSEFNRSFNANREFVQEENENRLKNDFRSIDLKILADKKYNKEISAKEFNAAMSDFEPKEKLKIYNRINDLQRLSKVVDRNIIDIKYEDSPKTRALMIINRYGNVFDGSKDSQEVLRQMMMAQGIMTPDVILEYNKLKSKYEHKK